MNTCYLLRLTPRAPRALNFLLCLAAPAVAVAASVASSAAFASSSSSLGGVEAKGGVELVAHEGRLVLGLVAHAADKVSRTQAKTTAKQLAMISAMKAIARAG